MAKLLRKNASKAVIGSKILDSEDLRILQEDGAKEDKRGLNKHQVISNPPSDIDDSSEEDHDNEEDQQFRPVPGIKLELCESNGEQSDSKSVAKSNISKIKGLLKEDYNRDLRHVEAIHQLQKQRNSESVSPENNDSLISHTSKPLNTKFAKKWNKTAEYVLPEQKIKEVNDLVHKLERFDRNIQEAISQKTLSSKKKSSNNLSTVSTIDDNELKFQRYHSRNLEVEEQLRKTMNKYSPDKHSYELIIEHERGLICFGIPFFSKSALLHPFDPPPFINKYGSPIDLSHNVGETTTGAVTYDMNLFPINGIEWKWTWDKWYVLMLDHDIDDQGWLYSGLSFSKRHWRGKYRFGNSVRKRYWIRIKERKIDDEENPEILSLQKETEEIKLYSSINDDLLCFFQELDSYYVDRQKIELLLSTFNPVKKEDSILELQKLLIDNDNNFKKVMKSFYFMTSLKILHKKLLAITSPDPIVLEFTKKLESVISK